MKLLLDIGNTRIKWGSSASGEIVATGQVTCRGRDANLAMSFLDDLDVRPERVAVLSVGSPEVMAALRTALMQRWQIVPHIVAVSSRCGAVVNGYVETGQLGIDRWAAIVGAWNLHRCDLCVVDAGTALTIDLVRADGQHLGGVIVPGLRLMEAALRGETADISRFAGEGSPALEAWYGRTTRDAIAGGALLAAVSAVDAAAADFAQQSGSARVLLTGGDAGQLAPRLQCDAEVRPHLVLEGLQILDAEA